eukprot:Hpha_TRINITY_DN11819_c0_g1::TRINITY_DN11819_c0_g1_i1::g.2202::m.2202
MEGESWPCPRCGEMSSTSEQLCIHLLTVHSSSYLALSRVTQGIKRVRKEEVAKRERELAGEPERERDRKRRRGVILFARVDPVCAGSLEAEGLIPVEVQQDARVGDIISQLEHTEAVRTEVNIEFQQSRLRAEDFLADVGLCPQSTVRVLPSHFWRRRRRIAGAELHSVAIAPDGVPVCWGKDHYRICDVPPVPSRAVDVAAGNRSTLCVLADGTLVTWGNNRTAIPEQCKRLNRGTMSIRSRLGTVKVEQVSAGWTLCAAVLKGGEVAAWGNRKRSAELIGPPLSAKCVQVAVGDEHVLLLLEDGTVRIMGTKYVDSTVRAIPDFPHKVVQISCGVKNCIALLEDGNVRCWGRQYRPVGSPPEFGRPVRQVAAGQYNSIALLDNGRVVQWGNRRFAVPEFRDIPVVEVAAGHEHSMALLANGTVECWGD